MKILQRIRAILVFIQFTITIMVVIILMYLFNKHHREIRRKWASLQKMLIGYDLEVIGKPDENAQVILLNHQSLLDIVVLEALHPGNLAWIAKKEITNLFIYGHIMKAPKMITVDREDRKSLLKLFKDVKDRLKNGRTIAIFPEGTRGKGEKLLKFKPGAKTIAEKLNLKVQPIVLVNTRNIVDSQNFLVKKGTVKVIYLDTIDPKSNENWYQETRDEMQDILTNNIKCNI